MRPLAAAPCLIVVLGFLGGSLGLAQVSSPGDVVGAPERSGSAVVVRTAHAVFRIEYCTPSMVRVRASRSGRFAPPESIMLAKQDWPAVSLRVTDGDNVAVIASSRVVVRVQKHPMRLAFADASTARVVTSDDSAPGGGVAWESDVGRVRMRLSSGEQFYGLGERMDRFNWRGHSVTLTVGRGQNPNHDLGAYNIDAANYCPVPLVLSTAGYGIFFHTDRATAWDMGERSPDAWQFGGSADEVDYYFIYGPSLKSVLASYADLTGHTPLLPKPAYGVNFGTYSGGTWGHEEQAGQDYVVALARRFRAEGIPADVIHLDSTWRRFGTLGGRNATSFEWREPNFANPAAMFASLRDLHFSFVGLHVRPRIDNGETTTLLDEARAAGAIANTPTANILDFFQPKAVEWWWQRALAPKVQQGAAFLKTDEGSIFPGDGVHNLFPVVYARAAYESFQTHLGRRGFNLTREGYAGIQRYPYIWAGDWPSRWKFFAPVVRAGLNVALSGVSAWGHNSGGFEEVATEELYLRWTPFGFFNPVAHFLGMEHPQYKEPWNYGPRALETFRRYAQLRYRLIPYIYSTAYDTWTSGVPVMRPLVLEYPEDPRVQDIDDQYLFGDALMVAPVTREGAPGRSVFLPPGAWFDYWSGVRLEGNRTIDYAAPPDVLPIFVKAGSIIPMQPDMAYIGEKPLDPLTLDVYPAGSTTAMLYEDDGLSLAYQGGDCARTRMTAVTTAARIEVKVDAPVGPFTVAPRGYAFRVHVDRAPRAVRVDGRALASMPADRAGTAASWRYDAASKVLVVATDPGQKRLAVRLEIDR
jgi:alpha-glucosidase